jgi:photosystem II stability/assembly factor-like uncharacterized protein
MQMMETGSEAKALHIATYSGWYRFEQRDEQWTQVDKALTFWKMTALQVDPSDPRHIYVATEHSGLFVTQNGGAEWQRAKPNVPRLTTTSLRALSGILLAGTVPAALYCTTSGGGWQELEGVRLGANGSSFPPSPELGARTRFLAADNETPRRLYAAIEVGGLLVSDDDGRQWRAAVAGLDDPDVHQILPSARHKGVVVAACGEGTYRSQDRGNRWEKITPQGNRTFGSAVTEDDSGAIYLGMALGRPNTWLRKERADAALFVSQDRGAHWDVAVEGLSGGIMAMCRAMDGRGVFVSTSEGDVLSVDSTGARKIISGLPSITAIAVGG